MKPPKYSIKPVVSQSDTFNLALSIRMCNGQRIPVNLIIRLEGFGNYTWIYSQDHARFLVSKTLKRMAAELPGFVRVHKSHVVNWKYIKNPSIGHANTKTWTLQLVSGEMLPWSRSRYRAYQQTQLALVPCTDHL